MPERIQREEPIDPASVSSAWRTTGALMEVFRSRPAPAFAFSLALATWAAAACRTTWPQLASPVDAGACLTASALFAPGPANLRRYLLHALWPLQPGYVRSFFASAVLLLEGYTLEHEVGSMHFAGLLLGLHVAASALLLYFGFTACLVSPEAALVALAVVMHRVNPKLHTDGLDKSLQVPFAVEPRWHLWVCQAILLLLAADFPSAMATHAAGMVVGGALALRDPEVWLDGWRAARSRSFGIGAVVHVGLLLFALIFMPLTAQALPSGVLQALLDGRALRRSWWQAAFPGSPPLLHLALGQQMEPQAFFICKLAITFAVPLLLTPFRIWTRFYAVACLLLAMYAMNCPAWGVPHVGFLALVYLTWAFWKLPGLAAAKQKQR